MDVRIPDDHGALATLFEGTLNVMDNGVIIHTWHSGERCHAACL